MINEETPINEPKRRSYLRYGFFGFGVSVIRVCRRSEVGI